MDKLIELIKSKSFSAAEKLLRKNLEESPNNCYLLTQLANVLWNRSKDKEALSYADKAKEVCPVMPLLNYTWQNPLVIRKIRTIQRRVGCCFKYDY